MGQILVTGATGYIGSHACVELLQSGFDVVGIDNFVNSSPVAHSRIEELGGRSMTMIEADLRDRETLAKLFVDHDIDAVMHFAGLKAVGESVADPLRYYDMNLVASTILFDAMQQAQVTKLVFSSSCTVYGSPDAEAMPLTEKAPLQAVSPYGATKLAIEDLLRSICEANPDWSVFALRYFNPIGAHQSGRIGEDPTGVPNNLLPFIMQTAVGRRPTVRVFGDDYSTADGTCVRDYIHVVDLVRGHLCALRELDSLSGFDAVNLGTGVGSSVLEVISASSAAIGRQVPFEVVDRRAGDAVEVFAEVETASDRLGWIAELDLADMCRDHWNWQQQNPDGYPDR